MGAHNLDRTFPGSMTPEQIRAEFKKMQETADYESGHTGYSGDWNTMHGVEIFPNKIFDDLHKANEWILDNTEKRGSAFVVKYKSTPTVSVKAPTFAGKPILNFSGKLSYIWQPRGPILPADQLEASEKVVLVSAYEDVQRAKKEEKEAYETFGRLTAVLNDASKPFAEYRELKKARTIWASASAKLAKAEQKFRDLDTKFVAKLYEDKKGETEIHWLMAGWAAS